MERGSKAIRIAVNVLLWVIVIIAAFFSIVTFASKNETGVAWLGGYSPMAVQTDSMKGEFSSGDLIVIRKTDASTLKEGDIITFWTLIDNQQAINTHRIIAVQDNNGLRQYMTKGDANPVEDTRVVAAGDVIGKYAFHIPKLGKLMDLLSSSTGFLVIIVLPLLLFFIWQFYQLIILIIEMKKEAVREAAEQTKAAMEAEIRQKLELEAEVKRKMAEEAAESHKE